MGIELRSSFPQDVTLVPNDFLDRFLPEANGDFVKLYLYLLRAAGRGGALTLSTIADKLNCTENDVRRALRYWEKEGMLAVTRDDAGEVTGISLRSYEKPAVPAASELPKSSDISSARMAELGAREDVRELFFIAQSYIGKPLSRAEMQKICFFYDTLHMSPDLIDYLIDYCVSRGHTSFRYIEKVALNWKDAGITTVHEARASAQSYHREYYDILKSLGIDNHHPVDAEVRVMKKWIEKYKFSMDIIKEACTRTVMNAAKPSLNYVDSILSKWNSAGVRSMDDIRALDAEHEQKKAARVSQGQGNRPAPKKNGFTDYSGSRSYDYDAIEAQLIEADGA